MALSEYEYNDIIHRCFRCGYCKFPTDWSTVSNCPAYARFRLESFSTGGRLWLIRAWINGEIEWSEYLAKVVYTCTTCSNCVEKCPLSFNDDIVNMIVAARSEMVETGMLPSAVKTFLENVYLHGNPFGISAKKRSEWTEGTGIEPYQGQEFLYYVGCQGSFDTRAQKAANALGLSLQRAGVSFGVLGSREICEGNEVDTLGEGGLFEELAEKNIALFRDLNVHRIITLSPHAYNTIKRRYPEFGGDFDVYHYTQILGELIKQGKLQLPRQYNEKVTYHDPCYLGRWNQEYSAPRQILEALDGVELVEMERNREGALCCGGGSANFVTDLLGGSDESPARIRIREAYDTGADTLAVACPNCLAMLEDALKAEGLDGKLKVRDISEIVNVSDGLTMS